MLRKGKKNRIIINGVYFIFIKDLLNKYGHKNGVIRWLIF